MTEKKPPRTQVKIDKALYENLKLVAMAEKMTVVDLVDKLVRLGYKDTYGDKTGAELLKERL
ncbi:hypothetical protein [Ligilactobacillus aviarius]|uniref:CopG family transcriptional regulator n=1 Tax=Ligilactobacillus aviarius TaxID=1606 RepID=A0A510WQ31_9LACO|nr:hypothetical protein [Ligilactobacillus aviarius]KRM38325.1 hypothetical protein FC33_GL000405 [Ligilactobacillus aviarius subsp. aviarius DSM 20655]GEK41319.1 hypothetical protein LAV01_01510 [Ligilactobacillus aviarius]